MKNLIRYSTLALLAIVAGISALLMTAGNRGEFSVTTPALSIPASVDEITNQSMIENYSKLPLFFEANEGQAPEGVDFVARGPGYDLSLNNGRAVLVLSPAAQFDGAAEEASPAVLQLSFAGASSAPTHRAEAPMASRSNYFHGQEPSSWHTNIPHYGKVRYEAVYPGIDVVFYGNQSQLEYDFVVAPDADPAAIALDFDGADGMALDDAGNLVLSTPVGDVVQHAPTAYQVIDGERTIVDSRYAQRADGRIGFEIGAYDEDAALTIDPVLDYATFFGGGRRERFLDVAIDAAGNAYATGDLQTIGSATPPFPTTVGAFQPTYNGANSTFAVKLDAAGNLVWSTLLSGSGRETGLGIGVDGAGNVYVTGSTSSLDFPTINAFQPNFGPGQNACCGGVPTDAFVTKFAPDGASLVYSTYLGGATHTPAISTGDFDQGIEIAVDAAGTAWVLGTTNQTDFPLVSPIQATLQVGTVAGTDRDLFVSRFSPSGALTFSTYLGGTGATDSPVSNGIAIDTNGDAYVAGTTTSSDFPTPAGTGGPTGGNEDIVVAKIDATTLTLVYTTFIGGSAREFEGGIAVDGAGQAHVVSSSLSTDYPTVNAIQGATAGAWDVVVSRLNASGSLNFSTYLGSSGTDFGFDIAADAAGRIYVTGLSQSANFPGLSACQAFGGSNDAFISIIDPSVSPAALTFSTLFGGASGEVSRALALNGAGDLVFAGDVTTPGSGFPLHNAFQSTYGGDFTDGFIAKFDVNAASIPGDCTTPSNQPPVADAGADAEIFTGGETTLGGSPTASGGTGALTIFWTPTTGLDDPSAANPTAELETTTTYTVTVTDENGCIDTDEITVTVKSKEDVISEQRDAVQALLDDPATDPDALGALQDAKDDLVDALEFAEEGNTRKMLKAMRKAAEALEEAREDTEGTDPIASVLADCARHVATEKKEEAEACTAPDPKGKIAGDIEDGDKDLADGDLEYADGYFGDAIKDYRKAWEGYCDAVDRCAAPKAASSDQFSVSSEQIVVSEFALHQNYPNPFNPATTIQFDLIDAGNISLNIYNSAGQLVRTLVSGDYAPGAHKVVWDAKDNAGSRVASGLYLYTIKVGQQFTARRKLLLMK